MFGYRPYLKKGGYHDGQVDLVKAVMQYASLDWMTGSTECKMLDNFGIGNGPELVFISAIAVIIPTIYHHGQDHGRD